MRIQYYHNKNCKHKSFHSKKINLLIYNILQQYNDFDFLLLNVVNLYNSIILIDIYYFTKSD